MTTPVEVALAALTKDAATWDETAGALGTAAAAADGLDLDDHDFGFMSRETGVDQVYTALQLKLARLCREGQTETALVASTLRLVRTEYESTDAAVRARLDGLWEVGQ